MRSSVELICIDPARVSDFWPYVEPLLNLAIDRRGNWSIDEIREQVDQGALVWIAWDGETINAACVTRLAQEQRGLVLEAIACGGGGQDWRRLYKEIENYGRGEGCVISRISGREGWRRIFNDYDLAWVALEKRLDG